MAHRNPRSAGLGVFRLYGGPTEARRCSTLEGTAARDIAAFGKDPKSTKKPYSAPPPSPSTHRPSPRTVDDPHTARPHPRSPRTLPSSSPWETGGHLEEAEAMSSRRKKDRPTSS